MFRFFQKLVFFWGQYGLHKMFYVFDLRKQRCMGFVFPCNLHVHMVLKQQEKVKNKSVTFCYIFWACLKRKCDIKYVWSRLRHWTKGFLLNSMLCTILVLPFSHCRSNFYQWAAIHCRSENPDLLHTSSRRDFVRCLLPCQHRVCNLALIGQCWIGQR